MYLQAFFIAFYLLLLLPVLQNRQQLKLNLCHHCVRICVKKRV